VQSLVLLAARPWRERTLPSSHVSDPLDHRRGVAATTHPGRPQEGSAGIENGRSESERLINPCGLTVGIAGAACDRRHAGEVCVGSTSALGEPLHGVHPDCG